MPQHSLRNAEIFVGGLSGIKVEVGDGNVTYTEGRPLIYTTEANTIADVREDDDKPVEVSLSFTWKRATATAVALLERIKGADGLTSSDTAAPCRPYAVDIVIKYRSNCALPATYRQIVLKDFRYDTISSDLKEGKIDVSGMCNVTKIEQPTIVT